MTVEIRPCKDKEELADYGRIVSYVFASTEGMDEELASTQPDWTTCGFVDGKMAATMGAWPFTVRLNGAPVPMGGVTAVGTLPHYRRRGLLRGIMTEGLATMRERGQPIAILWASMGAIYQRFGYGLAAESVTYSFDPRFAQLQRHVELPGTVEMLGVEEALPVIKPLYIEYATPRNLMIHRAMPLWQQGALKPRKKGEPVYVAVYRDEYGHPRGYITYWTYEERPTGPGGEQVLEVRDFVALDLEAYQGLWEFIRRHDLAWKVVMRNVLPADDIAPDLLLEPRMLSKQVGDAIWMRIVDAERALAARPYSVRGELRIAIDEDDMCPWNNGTFVLTSDGQTAMVERDENAADIVVTPNGLATLLSGRRSATELARTGRLAGASEKALRLADAMFATAHAPFCPDGF
ncbi:MAG: GNAT family N-acetyltransferase [Dehalococcoidia bacterium]|nr:GNAT family N-acetyltransferase [Dehalococcoidia bacterium]